MSYLRIFVRKAAAGMTLLVAWLTATAVWAALVKPPAKEEPSGMTGNGAYVWAYMLFILGIVLGLMVVCRSAGRRDRAKPEDYVESSLAETTGPSRGKK